MPIVINFPWNKIHDTRMRGRILQHRAKGKGPGGGNKDTEHSSKPNHLSRGKTNSLLSKKMTDHAGKGKLYARKAAYLKGPKSSVRKGKKGDG